uniref:Family with sequence similarity 189 member A1 n=1 Tax=Macrostomum lignano TaxID=282301 RepID=A0A1I8G2P4_9PLAT
MRSLAEFTNNSQLCGFIMLLTVAGCILVLALFIILCVPRCVKANKYRVFTPQSESPVQTQPTTPTFPLLPPSIEASSATPALDSSNSSNFGGSHGSRWPSSQLLLDPTAAMLEPAARFLIPRVRLATPEAAPPSGVILGELGRGVWDP